MHQENVVAWLNGAATAVYTSTRTLRSAYPSTVSSCCPYPLAAACRSRNHRIRCKVANDIIHVSWICFTNCVCDVPVSCSDAHHQRQTNRWIASRPVFKDLIWDKIIPVLQCAVATSLQVAVAPGIQSFEQRQCSVFRKHCVACVLPIIYEQQGGICAIPLHVSARVTALLTPRRNVTRVVEGLCVALCTKLGCHGNTLRLQPNSYNVHTLASLRVGAASSCAVTSTPVHER